jgi:deoxycytidine triphosphate deaminase
MSVILVNNVVDPKKNNQKKWRAEEEERHKGSRLIIRPNNTILHFSIF